MPLTKTKAELAIKAINDTQAGNTIIPSGEGSRLLIRQSARLTIENTVSKISDVASARVARLPNNANIITIIDAISVA